MSRRRRPHSRGADGIGRSDSRAPLTGSAQIIDASNVRTLTTDPVAWQRDAWAYYKSIGELRFALGVWLAGCMSRVRLVAAVKKSNEDNPQPIDDVPAAALVAAFGGGIGGQAALLRRITPQLTVPGESYIVGEDPSGNGDLRAMSWTVYSSDEIRIKSRDPITYTVNDSRQSWRDLAPESLVVRCWDPDEQYAWAATSVTQSALPVLREIDLYNRYIIAVLTSRLASNGFLFIPTEVTFPSRPEYKDRDDPFVAELIDVSSRAIKNPGSAAAAMPIPIRVPAQYVESFRHLTFATPLDEEVMDNRVKALERLATMVNVPAEVLTGMSKMNHWGQWQLEESGVKIYVSPLAELLVNCLTEGYLYPLLDAMGESRVDADGDPYIVWYDPSELTQQPDRSGAAMELADRGEISGEALRRESGFEEDDGPDDEEFKKIALRRIAMSGGADALRALSLLTGDESLLPPPAPAPVVAEPGTGVSPSSPPTASPTGETSVPEPTPATKTSPNTRPAGAALLTARSCPSCHSIGAPTGMCTDLWHVALAAPGETLLTTSVR